MNKNKAVILLLALTLLPCMGHAFFGDSTPQKKMMINPYGSAKRIGHTFRSSTEQEICCKIANNLANELSNRYNINVLLTRATDGEISHLQNAELANRERVDCFVSINVYKEEHEKPSIFLYHRMLDPFADLAKRNQALFSFSPIKYTHLVEIHKTKSLAERIKMFLHPDYQDRFEFHGVYGLPLIELEGFNVPAMLIDIGLNDEGKWPLTIEPLAAAFSRILIE